MMNQESRLLEENTSRPSRANHRRSSSVQEAHQIYLQYHREAHHHHHHPNQMFEKIDSKNEDDDDDYDDLNNEKNHNKDQKIKVHRIDSAALHGTSRQNSVEDHDHKPMMNFPMFHRVQKTGVIYATARATSRGFGTDPEEEWSNMGQGAPETGPIPNAPIRNFTITIPDAELEYAPVTGLPELCTKVAQYYNTLYRQNKSSLYTAENVCIVPGGRAGITRIMVREFCSFCFLSDDAALDHYLFYSFVLHPFLRPY
jgi:hypothetical protein